MKRWPCVDIAIRSTLPGFRDANQLVGGIAFRQLRVTVRPSAVSSPRTPFEIGAVVLHLLRLAQVQLIEVARDPAVGHVHEQQFGAGQAGQFPGVR